MSKFKVGERVAVYSSSGRMTGTVASLEAFGANVRVGKGASGVFFFHLKQLRRLKPKVKKEPRRIQIDKECLRRMEEWDYTDGAEIWNEAHGFSSNGVEFVEVLKKEKRK